MKKVFTLLFAVLFSAQFVAAQHTLYVYSKSGNLAAYNANKITFDNDFFTFTCGDVTEVTKEMFTASFKVAFKSDDYKSLDQTPEVGVCFSDINEMPTIYDGKIKEGSSLGTYTFSIYGLDAGTTYFYRAYVKVDDVVCYGEVKSGTTFGKKSTNNSKIINGHKFIDLGLPSGLLWAETNVGAAISADDGEYFAWGETEAKSYYDWNTYKYGTDYDNLTKYNSSDGKTTLEPEDGAAYVNWGDSCRMPTGAEFGELLSSDNCTWTWTSKANSSGSSIGGYKVTSVKNGNSIFLPASGYRDDGGLNDHGSLGYYWSSTRNAGRAYRTYCLYFNSGSRYTRNYDRCYGRTVRPVAEP